MGVILGIDIGGSSTKIVGLAPDLSVIDMLRVKADDPLTSLYGAMGNFLSTHHLQLSDIRHIALTGVGSSYVEGDIYGVKTIKVEEFPSVGVGGLALSGKEHAVVVSMGTGTSFLWANKGGDIRHLIGSGVGGGTLAGLSSLTTGVHQYALIRKLCPVGQDERDILERIFARYNQAFPPDYRGRSIAPSDVLELYDESERRYFYCDMAGFLQVKFSPALAKKA